LMSKDDGEILAVCTSKRTLRMCHASTKLQALFAGLAK
jgi:hypothetical protein